MFYLILISILFFLLFLLVGFYYTSFLLSLTKTKVPYVPSFNYQLEIMKKLELKKWKKIIDLWCGDGKALRFFEKQFELKCTWYEINYFAVLYGKLLNKITKSNTKIIKKNFVWIDLKEYDYIYIYLFPEFMCKIEDWIFKSKWENTIIISNSFEFKNHKAYKIIDNKIRLYK
jgi:hypothetical protein